MDNVLFIYNIALIIFFTIASTGFYVIYMKNRKKGFIFLSLLYLLLIIDNSIIYISEFSKSFELLYETSFILYVVIDLVYLGIILTTRAIVSELFDDKFTIREKQICVAVPIILLILNIFGSYEIGEALIHFAFFAALSYIAFRFHRNISHNPNWFNKKMLKNHKIYLWVIIILNIIAILESGFYFFGDLSNLDQNSILFEYRSISFDVIKLFICIIGVKSLHSSFENLFDKKSLDEKMNGFCIKYSLTSRQRDIIELIIDGYSNKEISNKLHITEGTVKTHIYNIFKKTDISNRNQIIKKVMED